MLREGFFNFVDLVIGHRRSFGRQRIRFVGPGSEIEELASLRAKRAEFISVKLGLFTTIRTLNYGHNKSVKGQITTKPDTRETMYCIKKSVDCRVLLM